MSRKLIVDFFRVRMPGIGRTFATLIEEVMTEVNENRNLPIGDDDVVRLHFAANWGECIEGEMTRLRMGEIPPKADLQGSVTNMQFGANEGIGEQTAFVYHKTTGALLVQRNKEGVSGGRFVAYFERILEIPSPILCDPSLRLDVVRRLADLQVIRKFRVHFARVDNPAAFKGLDHTHEAFIDVMNQFHAPTADISLSMGRKTGSLPVETVKSWARHLMRFGRRGDGTRADEVTKIDISGRDGRDESDGFDLMKERLIEHVEVVRIARSLPYNVRRDALRTAFKRRETELGQMYAAQ